MSSERKVEKLYKKLSHIEQILLRPDRYLGSTKPKTMETWLLKDGFAEIQWVEVTFNPVLLKMFDEIITNSVDFSKTPEGAHVDTIRVNINRVSGSISVYDNGGIPVVSHPDYPQGLLPDMLFGELFSSSNYNEEDEELANADSGGQNGEGASLVNIFSKLFFVETDDGVRHYKRTWRNNMLDVSLPSEVMNNSLGRGTTVSFIPDYAKFKGGAFMSVGDYHMLLRRAFEVAFCNPKLSIELNGKVLKVENFRGVAGMFGCGAVDDYSKDWKVAIAEATEFEHHSYVNSIHTWQGGPHVEYVLDKIITKARVKIKKKYKIDYKPQVVRNSISLLMFCNIKTPRFDTQTKDHLTTSVSDFGTKWEPSETFMDKAVAIVVKAMANVHGNMLQKEEDEGIANTEKELKRQRAIDIEKYEPATSSDRSKCSLFLTEGDSAAKPLLAARNTKTQGVFPLKGKSLNVINASRAKLLSNAEVKNIFAILKGINLKTGEIDEKTMRYRDVVVSTDADADGAHIRGLVIALFHKLCPSFIEQGRLKFLISPVVTAYSGTTKLEFFEEREFDQYAQLNPNVKLKNVKYLKGLGSNETSDVKRFMSDPKYIENIEWDEAAAESIDVAFNTDRVEDRKPMFETLKLTDIEDC